MGKGSWQATVHEVAELDITEHAHAHTHTHTDKLHTLALKASSSQWKSIFLLGLEISKYRQHV